MIDMAKLYRLLGWAICKLTRKHRRGKRFVLDGDTDQSPRRYRCPRCNEATWTRKVPKEIEEKTE